MGRRERKSTVTERVNHYPFWGPRFWHGMRAGRWWRLLASNGFRIAPRRLVLALKVSLFTPLNDVLAAVQHVGWGGRIRRTPITHPPLFIIGHWRSGTTLMHELLVSDPQFASPNTYQCFAPWHFLVSQWLVTRCGGFLMPEKRPMDNMAAGWLLPQEDEFALMNLGLPSPYLRVAFPRAAPPAEDYLDMQGLSETQRRRWRKTLYWFIQALTYHYQGRQLVLKSPTHTGRLAELRGLFPEAKFVHMTRDPRQLHPSTLRLWHALDTVQGLQMPLPEEQLTGYVGRCMTRMYAGLQEARGSLPVSQFADVRYEDLIADPPRVLRDLYAQLELGDPAAVVAAAEQRMDSLRSYQPNRYARDPAAEKRLRRLWADYAAAYGYGLETPAPVSASGDESSRTGRRIPR